MLCIDEPPLKPGLWPHYGVSAAELEDKAERLSRDHSRFRGALMFYFHTAAKLLRLSNDDFMLLPLVFVQTVIGLEKVLRTHYEAAKDQSLSHLLQQAVTDGLFTDNNFATIPLLPKGLLKRLAGKNAETQADKLAVLIPSLRNDLLHGDCHGFEFHELLPLIIQTREIVDAVAQDLPKSSLETMSV